jgi:hypothetical protein
MIEEPEAVSNFSRLMLLGPCETTLTAVWAYRSVPVDERVFSAKLVVVPELVPVAAKFPANTSEDSVDMPGARFHAEKLPDSNPSENSADATVIGSEAGLGGLVLGPSEAVTAYVWALPGARFVSVNDTVDWELTTCPTELGPPSRNTL